MTELHKAYIWSKIFKDKEKSIKDLYKNINVKIKHPKLTK